jgi:hypothetical protein
MNKFILWLKGVFGGRLWVILTTILDKAKVAAFEALEEVAREIITELMHSDLSGDDKRKAAFQRIKLKAIAKGIDVKDKFIYWTIETIYQDIKR